LSRLDDKVRGFQAGAVDYVTKPFQREELLARVMTHIRLYELTRQEAKARQLAEQANRLKSHFLSIVSHELRTPLAVIVGLSERLLYLPALPASHRLDLQSIYASGQQLSRMLNDVLDLASDQVGALKIQRAPLDLADLFREVALLGAQMAREKGLAWDAQGPATLPWICGDRTRVQQILLNLLANACKFTERGQVTLAAIPETDSVTFVVRDTGIGIAPEEQASIFGEFRQSARTAGRGYSGVGLGLAITQRLVELHDGRIAVESSGQEGKGTTFRVTFPTIETPDRIASAAPNRAFLVNPPTIVVADDEPALLSLYVEMIQAHLPTARILGVQNGRETLELARTELPDLIVLDLMMPDLDGFAVLEQLREGETTREVPVIVLTAQVLSAEDMAHLHQGVAAVLNKGVFEKEEILAQITVALSGDKRVGSEQQRLVRQAMAYIHAHYAEPLTRTNIAAHIGVSASHMDRCFREELEMSASAYLSRYRIRQAKRMLTSVPPSIAEVAYSVGFASSDSFSRAFKREVGVSPRTYSQHERASTGL
jgi:signal transduction histidine kinase/AraC-like DNA-binding protein